MIRSLSANVCGWEERRGQSGRSENRRNAGEALVEKRGQNKSREHTRSTSQHTTRIFSANPDLHPPTHSPKDPKTPQPILQSFVKIVRPAVSLVFRIACGFTNAPSRRPDPGRKYALCTFCT